MNEDGFIYRRVEKQIMALIDAEAIRPGDKLPSLRRLSSQLGVSIATVSQAYLELEKKGVLASRERSGFFLAPRAL